MAKAIHRLHRSLSGKNVACSSWCAFRMARSDSNEMQYLRKNHLSTLPNILHLWLTIANGHWKWTTIYSDRIKIILWGVSHIPVATYHPSSNGKAERLVQTFKQAKSKIHKGGNDWERSVANLLLTYRISTKSTTGVAPCELLMKRTLHTWLNQMRPDVRNGIEKGVRCQQSAAAPCSKEFKEGDIVWAQNYIRATSGFLVLYNNGKAP